MTPEEKEMWNRVRDEAGALVRKVFELKEEEMKPGLGKELAQPMIHAVDEFGKARARAVLDEAISIINRHVAPSLVLNQAMFEPLRERLKATR